MSDGFKELKNGLHNAERLVDILCCGFSVALNPTWSDLVGEVIDSIDEWETTGKLPAKIPAPPFVVYRHLLVHSDVATASDSALPPILFKQFKEKFLVIVHDNLLPVIKRYKQKNPTLDVNVFRPLLAVKLRS